MENRLISKLSYACCMSQSDPWPQGLYCLPKRQIDLKIIRLHVRYSTGGREEEACIWVAARWALFIDKTNFSISLSAKPRFSWTARVGLDSSRAT